MKRIIALTLCILMVIAVFSGCAKTTNAPASNSGSNAPSAPADNSSTEKEIIPASEMEDPNKYFTQFDEPVEIHVCMGIGSDAIDTLQDGDTAENNWYTRYLLDNYNIKVVFDWTASSADYDQKLSLAISSDTLPDAFVCGAQYWKAAARAGQLRDLSADWDNYIGDMIKAVYDSCGQVQYDACSFDGEMSCIAGCTVPTESVSVMMIRQDWLDQLGLEVPTNLEEVEQVALAFKEAKLGGDNTVAILGPGNDNRLYTTFYDGFNCLFGLDAVFTAMDAYPGFFYTDESGKVVYGSNTQETRDALVLLNKWYQEGILDPEIGVRGSGFEPVDGGSAGMFFGCWWNIGFGNPASFYNDENADWRAYPILNENGNWQIKTGDISAGQRLCINANASDDVAHAVMIILNVLQSETDSLEQTTEDPAWWPLRITIPAADFVDVARQYCIDILEGDCDVDLYKGNPLYNEAWTSARYVKDIIPNYTKGQTEFGRPDFVISQEDSNWQAVYSWIIGNGPYATTEASKTVRPAVSYYTPAMEMYWDNLESVEKAVMLSIIVGQSDISAFDDYVNQWMAEGGETILTEVAGEIG